VPLLARVDEAAARERLEALAAPVVRAPRAAALVFAGGRYVVRRDVDGVSADAAATARAFAADPTLDRLEVALRPVPASLRAADLAARAAEANALLRPLALEYVPPVGGGARQALVLSPTEVLNLFFVRRDGLEADAKAIRAAVSRLAAFDRAARPARYAGAASGGLKVVPERAGWRLDAEAAARALEAAVFAPEVRSVAVPVVAAPPAVTAASLPAVSALRVVSEALTTWRGSSGPRATNVRVAARLLDGAVLAPGEVFSFNDAIGPIELESGFKAALVISSGRTVEGVGGGVCQVSTTAFRAMYQAGLPVVERNQHAYRVHWYDPIVGFDAAVYQPVLDLKMRNDTAAVMVLHAIVDDAKGTLRVQVLATAPLNRTVVVSAPSILSHTPHPAAVYEVNASLRPGERRQVDWAADGYRVRITRKVFEGGAVRADTLNTNYRPWRAVYQVGPSRASSVEASARP
jgi:vancomycin resistance protein YoaR